MGCLSRDYDAVTQASTSLTMNSQHMRRLERFTVLMYSKNCESVSVNEARKMMFTHSLKSLENIPPTQHALFQHAKRSLLTATFIWKQSLSKNPEIPKPSEWGWEWNDRTTAWVPYWTDLPDASHGYYFIVVARSHARATANASEPEFDVVSCASVMEAVQTMLHDHELLFHLPLS